MRELLNGIIHLGGEPAEPTRTPRRVGMGGMRTSPVASGQLAGQATERENIDTSVSPANEAGEGMVFGGVRFAAKEFEQSTDLARVTFYTIINDGVKLAQHLYSRFAIAQVSPNAKDCLMFVDRKAATGDELTAVVQHLRKLGWSLAKEGPQGYWTNSALVMALSQGHLDANGLTVEKEISRDPNKNALFSGFKDIVTWAYMNNADDLDFAVDQTESNSQICFKIGGRYVRPPMFVMPTDTLIQMLGIAWQLSSGGADAAFSTKIEQQAKLELSLQRTDQIPNGARVRLRWSGMANDRGTVVTMRLQRLGESARIRSLESAGYSGSQTATLRRVMHSEGGMTVFSGVVGSGKSTSLAQLLGELPKDLKKISIEDPVELEIPYMYQKTITRDLTSAGEDLSFKSAVAAIYRSALDVLLLGEIRDVTTGMIARQVAESGHRVYTTTHAKGCLGIIDRFASPAIGIPREVLATPDILKVLVYQALLPTTCPHCALTVDQYASKHELRGDALGENTRYFARIQALYGIEPEKILLRNPEGCEHCHKADLPELNGFSGRTVVSEMVEPDDEMLKYILLGNNVELTRYWRSLSNQRYDHDDLTGKNAMECAIYKASLGVIDPREIEPRFMSFETVEQKLQQRQKAASR